MRQRATKNQILGSLCVLAVVAAALIWWWPHLNWSFQISRNQVRIPGVPVTELKTPGKTAGWYNCQIGPVSLKLPPELAKDAERSVGKMTVDFATPELDVSIHIPFKLPVNRQADFVQIADEFGVSVIHLIGDSYAASTDDFRWTMSRQELRRHQVLMMITSMFPHAAAIAVETHYQGPLEGLLIIHDRRHATFEWRLNSGAGAGLIAFASKERDLDLDMVRECSQSLTCDEGHLGPEPRREDLKKTLREILDSMTVVLP